MPDLQYYDTGILPLIGLGKGAKNKKKTKRQSENGLVCHFTPHPEKRYSIPMFVTQPCDQLVSW